MSPEPCTTVRCEAEAWAERAKVAKWAAEELDACGEIVARVLSNNYFGNGCVEAPPVFAELASAIAVGSHSWRSALTAQATGLGGLADTCAGGGRSLADADELNAKQVRK